MAVKNTIKKIITQSGLLKAYARVRPQACVILYFHSVSEDPSRETQYVSTGISVDRVRFREYMQLLRERFNPVTLDELLDWQEGKRELPRRSVVVTFDDGFENNYSLAAPAMEEFDIRGTIYLTAGCVEHQMLPWFCRILYLFVKAQELGRVLTDPETSRRWDLSRPDQWREAYHHYLYPCAKMNWEDQCSLMDRLSQSLGVRYDDQNAPKMMTWEQARELIARGHLIGNHTLAHPNVAHMTPGDKLREIERSHAMLAERLGRNVENFSYPHPCLTPQHDAESDEKVRSLGYRSIVLTDFGRVLRNSSALALHRVTVAQMELDAFLWKLETAFAGIKT